VIEIRHLYKRYRNYRTGYRASGWVLEDLNLTVPQGISVGVVGRNGAGKSTLLRLIGGMDTPNRGEVIRHARVSWPMGLSGGFQGSMTGRQNSKFVARVHGSRSIEAVIEQVEDFAGLGAAFDDPVRTYSSGMRSRLAFGLSLAFDFDLYLSDEATAVGDASFRSKAKRAFEARVGKASLMMVSHAEDILKELCQAGIWLHEGQAHWFDSIDDALAEYQKSLNP
jgi:capsular polysaccharide transport system ATP-binding protein